MPTQHVNGIDIYYEVAGQGDPVLLIHGLGSSTRDWEKQLPALTQAYQVITVDVRGCGQSGEPPGPYSIAGFAADIAAFMEAINLESAHMIGISMGATIGFQLALDHPARLRSLIAINAPAAYPTDTFKQKYNVWLRFAIVNLMGMRKMGEVLAGRLFPDDDQADIRQIFTDRWAENDPRAYKDVMRALVGWSMESDLERIEAPILVISSELDYYPTPDKQAYVDRLPNATLTEIANARHAVTFAHPEWINPLLSQWLDQQTR